MDLNTLEQHEAFLRAIFDAPEDDLPRLVYADFLEDTNEVVKAEVVRLSIESKKCERDVLQYGTLQARIFNLRRSIGLSEMYVGGIARGIIYEDIPVVCHLVEMAQCSTLLSE